MTLQSKLMEINSLAAKLQIAFPQFIFVVAEQAYWSPETQQIYYNNRPDRLMNTWSLLHELGHAILEHRSYGTDMDLLQKEVAAWAKANTIAIDFSISIDQEYAENCLETYRNWLYKRSTCPECGTHGIQDKSRQYYCLNCKARWTVSTSRFCRPYRGKAEKDKSKKSQEVSSWLFVENASYI